MVTQACNVCCMDDRFTIRRPSRTWPREAAIVQPKDDTCLLMN